VALADERVQTVERDEVVQYVDRRFVLTRRRTADLFDERVSQLQAADFANLVLKALRPVPSLSLTSDVICIAERVAGGVRDFSLERRGRARPPSRLSRAVATSPFTPSWSKGSVVMEVGGFDPLLRTCED
jgi:hypothetical protein